MSWFKGRFLSTANLPIDFVFYIPEIPQNTQPIYESALHSLHSLHFLKENENSIDSVKMCVVFEDELNHPYQIGIQSAIPPNVLFWQFELQSTRFPHDLNDIPEIPTIEDEIEEKELESPSSSFPIQSSLQDENNMNFLFDFTNLELDTSFPDLVSGPTSFIL